MRPQLADGFAWIETESGAALVCKPLEAFAGHLFTTREWALGSTAAQEVDGPAAWAAVATALGAPASRLARLHQVHGAAVVVKRSADPHGSTELSAGDTADIIISDDRQLVIAIQTADCVPLLMADMQTGAVAAAHAGWRGLAASVPGVAVRAMAEQFGSRPNDLVAAVGPSISAARYEVGEDVRVRFETAGFTPDLWRRWFPAETRPGHWLFDGGLSARDQLQAAGVPAAQVHQAGVCTAQLAGLFCSYRRDGRKSGRMAAAIRAGYRSGAHD